MGRRRDRGRALRDLAPRQPAAPLARRRGRMSRGPRRRHRRRDRDRPRPAPEVDKDVEFGLAANGISGIETALGVVLAAVDAGLIPLAARARGADGRAGPGARRREPSVGRSGSSRARPRPRRLRSIRGVVGRAGCAALARQELAARRAALPGASCSTIAGGACSPTTATCGMTTAARLRCVGEFRGAQRRLRAAAVLARDDAGAAGPARAAAARRGRRRRRRRRLHGDHGGPGARPARRERHARRGGDARVRRLDPQRRHRPSRLQVGTAARSSSATARRPARTSSATRSTRTTSSSG